MTKVNTTETVSVQTTRKIWLSEDDIKHILKEWAANAHGFSQVRAKVDFESGFDGFFDGATITDTVIEETTTDDKE